MKEGKPFFYRIDLIDLFDFATEPEGMDMSLLEFVKELKKGQSDVPAIQKIIDEANNFIEKKKKSGRLGGIAKASTAIASLENAIAKASTPLASNSSSNNTETETEKKEEHPLTPSYSLFEIRKRFREMIGSELGGGVNESLSLICKTYTTNSIEFALLATSTTSPRPKNPFMYFKAVLEGQKASKEFVPKSTWGMEDDHGQAAV